MKKAKKKKSAFQTFLFTFLKSILLISALLLTGFAGYKLTYLFYDTFGGPSNDSKSAKLIQELYGEVEVTDVPVQLIYCVGEEGNISGAVLEIFNTNTGNMDYITIPMKAQFALSNELFQKLCSSGCDTPQIMKFSKIGNYFNDKTMYEYGSILLEDVLGIDIHFYTAVPAKQFKKVFKKKTAVPAYTKDGLPMESYCEWKMKKSFVKKLREMNEDDLEKYVKEVVSQGESNLNMKSRMEYVKSYSKINPDYIHVHSLFGTMSAGDFNLYIEENKQLLNTILSNPAYESAQTSTTKAAVEKVSLGYSIEILNGSQINGLAADYQKKLSDAGYMISSIGNYNGELVSQTKIRISKEGLGTDLLSYFGQAVIEKAELEYGCDIQIILGTDADTTGGMQTQ